MSWDASLHAEGCAEHTSEDPAVWCRNVDHWFGDWNYTHNTNAMVLDALARAGIELPDDPDRPDRKAPWWMLLDGQPGPVGGAILHAIIGQLEADPAHFKEMDPPNKWGSYETLLGVLRRMRDAVPEQPAVWSMWG